MTSFFTDLTMDKPGICTMLNKLLASERMAAHQYRNHAYKMRGMYSTEIQAIMLEHATEEDGHADLLEKMIHDLGGELEPSFASLFKMHPAGERDTQTSSSPREMLIQDIGDENLAIAAYTEAVNRLKDSDYFDIAVELASILRMEREHSNELLNLIS